MKILVIEDNPTDARLAGAVLRIDGHHVTDSPSGEGGLSAAMSERPDVILLDLRLPGINGLEVTRALRRDPRTCATPIVAVTSYPEQYLRDELLAAGCDAYLVKPVDTRELSRKIENVVHRKEQERRLEP
ncbi:MAG TPA: response regulator [Opitutaceae bacterium]